MIFSKASFSSTLRAVNPFPVSAPPSAEPPSSSFAERGSASAAAAAAATEKVAGLSRLSVSFVLLVLLVVLLVLGRSGLSETRGCCFSCSARAGGLAGHRSSRGLAEVGRGGRCKLKSSPF